MCNALVWSFDAITSVNWLGVIKALASVAMALIAFAALKNWKRQDDAKRKAEFLDALLNAVNSYVEKMPVPITLLESAKIALAAYAPSYEEGSEEEKARKGAIEYIENHGEATGRAMLDALDPVYQPMTNLQSLMTKGYIFSFNNYAECIDAIESLLGHFNKIQAFSVIIGRTNMNWEHPMVLSGLNAAMTMQPEEMRKSINASHVAMVEFVRDAYAHLYGKTPASR